MKAKAARFYRNNVHPKTKQVKEDGAKWFLRNSVIFARLYENSQRKKGWFFGMKAKLVKFYINKVEPKLKSARARLTRFKLWVTGRLAAAKTKVSEAKQQGRAWLARHKRIRWVTAIVAIALVTTAILVYLWQRSPVFRATVKTLGVAILSILITLWALLKGLGLTLGEGLSGLGRGLSSLGTGILNILVLLWTRLTQPIIKVTVVTRSAGDTIPVPPIDGRLL
ncbi:MAG: hypothetical protein HS126_37735 [Anaerolineales bacterium]|nr:hypothetical protein [Anaerolineales bacterium]